MKKKLFINKVLKAALLVTATTPAFAVMPEFSISRPYIGVDFMVARMGFKEGFGGKVFQKLMPTGEVYLGVRFNDYISCEVGYGSTTQRSAEKHLGPGDVFDLGSSTRR